MLPHLLKVCHPFGFVPLEFGVMAILVRLNTHESSLKTRLYRVLKCARSAWFSGFLDVQSVSFEVAFPNKVLVLADRALDFGIAVLLDLPTFFLLGIILFFQIKIVNILIPFFHHFLLLYHILIA